MSLRCLLSLVVLIALMAAPFGRIGVADAAMADHSPAAMEAHCLGDGTTPLGQPDDSSIDCTMACATVIPAHLPATEIAAVELILPRPLPVRFCVGLDPESEPPPPRFS